MFTLTKTNATQITFTIPQTLSNHQFIIKPSSDATTGTFTFHVLIGEQYVPLKGVDVQFELLRPIQLEGIFSGCKFLANDFDGTSFTVEYIGE